MFSINKITRWAPALALAFAFALTVATVSALSAPSGRAAHDLGHEKIGPSGPQPQAPITGPTPPAKSAATAPTPKPPIEHSDANLVKARPRVTGEFVPDVQLSTLQGEKVSLSKMLEGKFTVLTFSKPENLWFESALGYFKRVVPYLMKLGYQMIIVTPDDYDYIRDIGQRVKAGGSRTGLMIDESRKSFMAMGLTDTSAKDGPSINAIFLVSPTKQIMFQFASVSDLIPFSGEVLVLAARVYKDAYKSDSAFQAPPTKDAEKK